MLSTFGRSSRYSRPQFALLSAASSATRGRESMSCKVSWGNRYMKVKKDSFLSCHITKVNHDISVFESRFKGHLFHKRRLIVWL